MWSYDYQCEELPSVLDDGGIKIKLKMVEGGASRYILNYVGWAPFEDRPEIFLQAYADTEEEAIANMKQVLADEGF